MLRFPRLIGLLALMVFVLGTSIASARFFQANNKANDDIVDLAKEIEKGADEKAVAKKVAEIKKNHEELGTIMTAYKPKAKGGIGYGEKGVSIEIKLGDMEKNRGIAPATLKKEEAELVKMAYVNIAIAEIAKAYPQKKGGKGEKEWNKHNDDQKKAAMELIAAIKGGEQNAVKNAAKKLNAACYDCHGNFRD
jgi:hypothetical protein